ncbi:PilZ domain-containing protein [Desulfoluna sp.]|uniref:PilZ domain-containing protein n=1 Tax=Desulfoluna sp. TaxID=2045199 RepID=UPI00263031ED|nr:PilZ domain-containing protein [Desulfoluna sp.]
MEKRKFIRFNSTNLLSYTCMNAENVVVQQGMGKTLDVSEGGILLETHVPIAPEHHVQLDIGFKDEVAEISGHVAYSRKGENGRSESGIQFGDLSKESHQILLRFIESFNRL